MLLKGHHAAPEVTHTHLRKRRISLGVRSILDIYIYIFFYDNDIHKTLILNNKITKKNKEQNIKTRRNIHRQSNASMNAAQNI